MYTGPLENFDTPNEVLSHAATVLSELKRDHLIADECSLARIIDDIEGTRAAFERITPRLPIKFVGTTSGALAVLAETSRRAADLSPKCVEIRDNGNDEESATDMCIGSCNLHQRDVNSLFDMLTHLPANIAGRILYREIYKLATTLETERAKFRREKNMPDRPSVRALCNTLNAIVVLRDFWTENCRYSGKIIPVIDETEELLLEQIGDLENVDEDSLFALFNNLFKEEHIERAFSALLALSKKPGNETLAKDIKGISSKILGSSRGGWYYDPRKRICERIHATQGGSKAEAQPTT